jgi:hypothetical protein
VSQPVPSGVLGFTVSPASTTVLLAATPTNGTPSTKFTLSARVRVTSPGRATTFSGTVDFYDNGVLLRSVAVTSRGLATDVETFATGAHHITALYDGNSDLNPSPPSSSKLITVS